ncbi:VOC family protein [Acaryochloris sp. CCMEE 5410]|uniref:VOC family protein n=1 Tax=Acaryochloris sp. CCMEE 5410 TaxID=310037 RepID=UPI00024851DF
MSAACSQEFWGLFVDSISGKSWNTLERFTFIILDSATMLIKKSVFYTSLILGLLVGQVARLHPPVLSQAVLEKTTAAPQLLQPAAQKNLVAVKGVSLTVSDMDQALAFYTKVLPFKKVSDTEVMGTEYERLQGVFGLRMRVVQLQLGRESIELIDYLTPGGRPIPVDSRSNDLWFQHIAIVVRDMDAAYKHLRQHKVQHASTGPQRFPDSIPAAAGIEAFYFRDPDGHNLEIIFFPPDKGDPRWQEPTKELFLGIDHTAIAISNTQVNRKFYENLLGLELLGHSENFGTEQEHLNNVFGARLLISGLKAPTGSGVEFLDYLAPTNGRPIPLDSKADDLWHWATILQVTNIEQAAEHLRQGGATFISPGVITLPPNKLGFRKGFLVKDPDGHVLRVVQL